VRQLVLLAAGGILLLCSALSRESGLIFPVLGLAFFIYRNNWTHLLKTLGVVAFVGVIYFSLRAGAEHYPPPRLTTPPPLLIRPIIIARAVAEYAGLIVFPLSLHVDRDVETQSTGLNEASFTRAALRELQTLLGIILIALFVYWLLRARKRNPAAFLSLVFALITYLPISGIATLNASVAEHWIYLPSAFLFLAAALQIDRAVSRTASHRIRGLLIPTIVVVWAIFLGVRTFLRTFDWKDQRTFLERTIASGGDSARMLINLGAFELNQGKFTDAAVHLHAALQKKPDQPLAILNLAAVALKQGDYKVARDLATRACQMPLVDAEAHQLLAIVESKENGKLDLMRMRLAAHTGPPNWPIEKRYIQLLAEAGADKGAVDELLTCLQTQWYRADSWKLLSELHAKLGHATQAANALAQAREYDVHLSSAALN
jgi:tetratricopeptide (TPR) repeat protein